MKEKRLNTQESTWDSFFLSDEKVTDDFMSEERIAPDLFDATIDDMELIFCKDHSIDNL
ncbi:MAG: hypothetical protein Q3M24_19290 [Candidatus Electrothrix aestuarii]|uniref:Uncharacterized protein n=1 Tax=Candidatus Electrothrix aestuarii TaxID=3062594 RepID=A0AAU8LTE8_9BACT|nr:hypothetical protein [Candidatus Electrothrix aestuarii]